MKKQTELIIRPSLLNQPEILRTTASKNLKIDPQKISSVIPIKRSIDARSKNVVYRILVDVYIDENPSEQRRYINYQPVPDKKKVIIVGTGPGGLFSSLKLIEHGIKPILIERGKDVQARRRDLRALQQEHIVNPESNYCFGEGGAGTYSDGKLYTRSTKRGDVKRILDILVQHGANDDISIDAHPHIGSNKLPKIIQAMRDTILQNGGEIHFASKLTGLLIKNDAVIGIKINNEIEFIADAVILATGHSARDVFYLLHNQKILIEPKPFAMGVRIEHPQKLIDSIQYHTEKRGENLPAASYTLACNVEQRGVYSFCMCPGGIIVPSATSPGEIVVNGMSVSRRDSPFANSGFVVEITENEWQKYSDEYPFAGLKLQIDLEQRAYELANRTLSAPAQRVTDFVHKSFSSTLPKTSYIPGVTSAALHEELPEFITRRLKTALKVFDKKMKGYYSEEAIIVGVESRTSSPIRIPRDNKTFMHPQLKGLFPCGEGAGYAGGIVSAAIDGENIADAIAKMLN